MPMPLPLGPWGLLKTHREARQAGELSPGVMRPQDPCTSSWAEKVPPPQRPLQSGS